MDKPELFQIGTVAKLFHLSVSSLRHYEDIGLLKPEYVSPESGYRYYSARQFEVLSSIRYLRALDLPLPEIADFSEKQGRRPHRRKTPPAEAGRHRAPAGAAAR